MMTEMTVDIERGCSQLSKPGGRRACSLTLDKDEIRAPKLKTRGRHRYGKREPKKEKIYRNK